MKRLTKLFSLSLVLTLLVSLLALPAYADSDVVSAPTGGVYYVDDAGCLSHHQVPGGRSGGAGDLSGK